MSTTAEIDMVVLVRGEHTNGHASLIEIDVAAGWPGPPLHMHDFDETFYVLEGELTFQVGQDFLTKTPGELGFVARGVPHTLANRSRARARYLLICTPAGLERYFVRWMAERDGVEPPAWALGPSPEVIVVGPQICEQLGTPTSESD